MQEQIVEVEKMIALERVSGRIVEQISDVPVPVMEETVEVVQMGLQERIQEGTAEKIIGVFVPHVMEEMTEVAKIIPQERVQNRAAEQIVDLSLSSCRGRFLLLQQ